MKLEKLEIEAFRGLVKESITLKDLTVFSGEMGIGKTSRLLAILFGLTGSTLPSLNLDDLINIESEFMWIRIKGIQGVQTFFLERRKRRGHSTIAKTDLPNLQMVSEKIFIEGREISKLFIGAPTEKVFKIDALLGLSVYDHIISEISTAPVERRIDALMNLKSSIQQYQVVLDKTAQVEDEINNLDKRIHQIDQKHKSDASLHTWAEEITKRVEEGKRRLDEVQSKRSLQGSYKAQIASIPTPSKDIEDDLRELEAKYNAVQKRIAFLEAAMQTLDLEGKKVEEITLCPLCGALISPSSLEKFKHYGEEYKKHIESATNLEPLLNQKKKVFEETRKNRERIELLQSQIIDIEREISQILVDTVPEDEYEKAEGILKEKAILIQEKMELEINRRSLEEQRKAYKSTFTQVQHFKVSEIDHKIKSLTLFGERLKKIKDALMGTVNETRVEQLESLRTSFKETFKRIYPYRRFTDVDFETTNIRGREVLLVKVKTDGGWIYSHQMSTGENVAVSFALLCAINHLEKSPILLFDEPEEGLDEKGVEGLADVLNHLTASTQIVVATRSSQLAQLLENPVESVTQD